MYVKGYKKVLTSWKVIVVFKMSEDANYFRHWGSLDETIS